MNVPGLPPLPRGPYPTAKWPEGCTHLPQPTDAAHVASLIRRHPSYSAQELATLISALASHAAHMDGVGLYRFDEVSALLDKAHDLAADAYMVTA